VFLVLFNGGVDGSLLSTPIVNKPQSGILGLHAIQDRPVARGGQVVIRPMMNLALTYDHRIIDGREAVTFLKRIKETIEDPSRLFLEVQRLHLRTPTQATLPLPRCERPNGAGHYRL
jgi:pyruvate/2-oxoglutarate dehydrogenase complex dihydrolipoamide acyltransferase (E2) component